MDNKIVIKINSEEKNLIKEEATRRGLATSSFCRFIILKELRKEESQ